MTQKPPKTLKLPNHQPHLLWWWVEQLRRNPHVEGFFGFRCGDEPEATVNTVGTYKSHKSGYDSDCDLLYSDSLDSANQLHHLPEVGDPCRVMNYILSFWRTLLSLDLERDVAKHIYMLGMSVDLCIYVLTDCFVITGNSRMEVRMINKMDSCFF